MQKIKQVSSVKRIYLLTEIEIIKLSRLSFILFSELIEKQSEFRTNESKYFDSTKLMIQFEQAAQTAYIEQFKTTNIRLLSEKIKISETRDALMFYFPIKVSNKNIHG